MFNINNISYTLFGAIITLFFTWLKHYLEKSRNKSSEIRPVRIKIYSDVITEMGGVFTNPDKFETDIKDPNYLFKFENKLCRILAPAQLVSSDEVYKKIEDVYNNEIILHKYLFESQIIDKDYANKLENEATYSRRILVNAMRTEIKK